MTRLTWICHGATAANRQARFPLDEPLEERAVSRARALSIRLPRADRVFSSPALRARETARALDLSFEPVPDLADCDYGRWAGRSIVSLQQSEPDALAVWMSRPEEAPHGGEAIAALCERVALWMRDTARLGGHTIALTHATLIRAAILTALDAPLSSFWHVDIEPLATVQMTSNGSRWSLRIDSEH
jgi:broad specificity phosphatase PhoE